MKLYIVPNTGVPVKQNVSEYFEMDYTNFIDLVFGSIDDDFSIIDERREADLLICGIQTLPDTILDKKTMLVCVENCSAKGGRPWYKHFKLYEHFNDSRICIYIYNDLTKLIVTSNYLAIPFIYLYIDQFLRLQQTLQIPKVPFSNKKFCLFTSRNLLNDNKLKVLQELEKYGEINTIDQFPELKGKTCYHSKELLNLYSQYKFIVCFENSHTDGYITEKLFNVFLSGSIPIYNGAPDVGKYINVDAMIRFDDTQFLKKVLLLNSNETLYQLTVNRPKISKSYDNENWSHYLSKFLE